HPDINLTIKQKKVKSKQSESQKEKKLCAKPHNDKEPIAITKEIPMKVKSSLIKGNPIIAILDFEAAPIVEDQSPLAQLKNVRIILQDIVIPIGLKVIESIKKILLLETDWFTKARAILDFDKHTLNIRYLGRQTTINTTLPIPVNKNKDKNEDQWIDDLKKEDNLLKKKNRILIDIGILEIGFYFDTFANACAAIENYATKTNMVLILDKASKNPDSSCYRQAYFVCEKQEKYSRKEENYTTK
ncbi:3252_t:CDS:2, partial [Gigaspora margarita]